MQNNSKKLIELFEIIIKKNISYCDTLIYVLHKQELPNDVVYGIIHNLFYYDYIENNSTSIYEIDKFISININKALGYNAIALFKVIRNKVISIIKKNSFHYFDLGAICDYISTNEYISYEKYIIKTLKLVIDNMLPSDVYKSFDVCSTKYGIDRKIKLYFIDKHFEILKDKIDVELFDSIDSVASVCWLIRHHIDYINSNNSYREKLLSIVNACQFLDETENDSKALKHIIESVLDGNDYKSVVKYGSHYEYCDFYNVGKHFWSSPIIHQTDKILETINRLELKKVVDFINNYIDYSFDMYDVLKEYFSDYNHIVDILRSPELFLNIKNEKYYYSILSTICKDNNIEKELIKGFIKKVYSVDIIDNAWLWLEVIDNNKLIDDLEFSLPILEEFFNILVEEDYVFKYDKITSISNSVLFKCFKLLCLAHTANGDIIDYITISLDKYRSRDNYYILLSAIVSKYDYIYLKNRDIKKLLISIIDNNVKEEMICIYNGLIFTNLSLSKALISEKTFRNIFPDLDSYATEYYSYNILLGYVNYEDDLVYYIAETGNINVCDTLIDRFINNNYGEINKLLNIVEHTINNKRMNINMFGELLMLLKVYPQNEKLREICSDISKIKYSFLDWDKLQNPILDAVSIDEDYVIKNIFIPMSDEYLKANSYYVEKKYINIFDNIYNCIKKNSNKEKMKKMANKAFQKGLTTFKKYK